MKFKLFFIVLLLGHFSGLFAAENPKFTLVPTRDDGKFLVLPDSDLVAGAHHTRHLEIFGKYVQGINAAILKGIDIVQSYAMDGGGYFTGVKAVPAESPVYYNLQLFKRPLIEVPRQASYCSGATYSAFIETLNLLLPERGQELSEERYESIRMQELDGSRREDLVKFWGNWNANGAGSQYALVQYAQMGTEIKPAQLRPGDFVNIYWRNGLGHAVIFLGWVKKNGIKHMLYWSSQKGTNGYGDQLVPLRRIKKIKGTRLTHLDNLFNFDVNTPVKTEIETDKINW